MEIPGDFFKPYIGWVNQSTFAPVGPIFPWKMSKTSLDLESDGVPTPNNAIPGFKTSISAKRGGSGKVEQACYDPLFSIDGINPFLALVTSPLVLHEGLFIRMACIPDTSVAGPLGIADVVGSPILGSVSELLATVPFESYVFLSIRITKIHHMADAAAGQPFDFDFESVYPYFIIGENPVLAGRYGFVNGINLPRAAGVAGGFC